MGVEKGSGTPKATKVGNLTPEAIVKVAQMKSPDSYAKNLRNAVKEIAGTCVSMGVNVDSKDPKEFIKEVNEGKYDQVLAGSDGKDVREKEE